MVTGQMADWVPLVRTRMVPDAGNRRELTAEEAGEVRRLRDGKYRSWAWTWGRTPAFVYERCPHLPPAG